VQVGIAAEVIVPICSEPVIQAKLSVLDQRSTWWLSVIGRPKPGFDARQVTAGLKTVAPQVYKVTVPENWRPPDQKEYESRSFEDAACRKWSVVCSHTIP